MSYGSKQFRPREIIQYGAKQAGKTLRLLQWVKNMSVKKKHKELAAETKGRKVCKTSAMPVE